MLGREKVECRVVYNLSDAQHRALGLALNRISENSSWDDGTLRELLSELDSEGEELSGLGFSANELDKLLDDDTAGDPLEVVEVETSEVHDEFWISIRGSLSDQAAVLKAMEEACKPFTSVSVDLGTIAIA